MNRFMVESGVGGLSILKYGKYLLTTGSEPTTIAQICGTSGINDVTIMLATGVGTVPNIGDYTATTAVSGTTATISVSAVQGTALGTAVTDTWTIP